MGDSGSYPGPMAPLVVTRSRRSRSALLVALLVAMLALASTLAYQAQDAVRSHRATAEHALRDYAEFAALGFGVRVKEGLYSALEYRMSEITGRRWPAPGTARSPFGTSHTLADDGARKTCSSDDLGMAYFRLQLKEETLATKGGCATPALRAWLADTVGLHAHTSYDKKWEWAVVVGTVEGEPRIVGYALERGAKGWPTAAYGFVEPFDTFATASLGKNVMHWPLLPTSLTGGAPNEAFLSARVTDRDGFLVFRTPAQYAERFTGTMDLPEAFGGLLVQVALNPEAAAGLVIGGLPRSRLPLLLGLVALTAALVAVALLQLRREAELNRLRGDFISNVSHELRTPLAQIRMFAETLLLGRVRSPDEHHRSLQIIDQEARRLTHLVENVLQFSRSEHRTARLTLESTELGEQVRETIEGFEPLAQTRRIDLRAEIGDGCTVRADRGALRQILLNLLDNAVKYGPVSQTVTIRLERRGDRVRLSVEDQGPGVPPVHRNRVFEPFYRLEHGTESAVAGSGIGLAVVRELVEMHGGQTWVESAAGGGARFVVELPVDDAQAAPRTPVAAEAIGSTNGGPALAAKETIK